MSQEQRLILPTGVRLERGWPRSTETYLFEDGSFLERTINHRWRPHYDLYTGPDGRPQYARGAAGEAEAQRTSFLEDAVRVIADVDPPFAYEIEHFLALE